MTDKLSIISEDFATKTDLEHKSEVLTELPVSYVLWLTMRSRFIDEIGKKDPEILNLWSNFEAEQMQILEKEVQNVL